MMDKKERAKMFAASAIMNADEERKLEALGDWLSDTHEYPMVGIEAIHYHLIQKHNWLPRDVKSMSTDDIKLACAKEIEGLPATEELTDFQLVLTNASLDISRPRREQERSMTDK